MYWHMVVVVERRWKGGLGDKGRGGWRNGMGGRMEGLVSEIWKGLVCKFVVAVVTNAVVLTLGQKAGGSREAVAIYVKGLNKEPRTA